MDQAAIIVLCRIAANSVEHALLAEQMLEDTFLTQPERQRWMKCLADHRWTASAITEILPAADLLAARRRTTGAPGDEAAHVLLAEIGRRGLDAATGDRAPPA